MFNDDYDFLIKQEGQKPINIYDYFHEYDKKMLDRLRWYGPLFKTDSKFIIVGKDSFPVLTFSMTFDKYHLDIGVELFITNVTNYISKNRDDDDILFIRRLPELGYRDTDKQLCASCRLAIVKGHSEEEIEDLGFKSIDNTIE